MLGLCSDTPLLLTELFSYGKGGGYMGSEGLFKILLATVVWCCRVLVREETLLDNIKRRLRRTLEVSRTTMKS